MMIRIGDFDFRIRTDYDGNTSLFVSRNCGDAEGEGMEISLSRFNRIFEDLFEKEM
jgi:hypothetical protein